jgi:hypothetical protein
VGSIGVEVCALCASLLADLLSSVFIHERDYTLDEVDRIIDERMGPGLDSYITMQDAALSPP